MYSLRQLSSACFRSPGKLWLYSGATITSPSAAATIAENAALLIASPASSTGSGNDAMSITSLHTPARRFSRSARRVAACTLAQPLRLGPEMPGMRKCRGSFMFHVLWRNRLPRVRIGSQHQPAALPFDGSRYVDGFTNHLERLCTNGFSGCSCEEQQRRVP